MGEEPSIDGRPSGPSGTWRTVLVVTVLTILVTCEETANKQVNFLLAAQHVETHGEPEQ